MLIESNDARSFRHRTLAVIVVSDALLMLGISLRWANSFDFVRWSWLLDAGFVFGVLVLVSWATTRRPFAGMLVAPLVFGFWIVAFMVVGASQGFHTSWGPFGWFEQLWDRGGFISAFLGAASHGIAHAARCAASLSKERAPAVGLFFGLGGALAIVSLDRLSPSGPNDVIYATPVDAARTFLALVALVGGGWLIRHAFALRGRAFLGS